MKRPVKPTVVMCGNDVLAVGAINKAKDMGLNIPEDISITGFDDIELSTVIEPNLTTVHVPHRQMGRRSAQTLINMINTNQTTSDSEELSAYICMRDTLGNSAR
jgi:LacI family transcriptional regulator